MILLLRYINECPSSFGQWAQKLCTLCIGDENHIYHTNLGTHDMSLMVIYDENVLCTMSTTQLENVFLPPGTSFLRRNFPKLRRSFPYMEEDFPNIEEKLS